MGIAIFFSIYITVGAIALSYANDWALYKWLRRLFMNEKT